MVEINLKFITYRLEVDPDFPPVKQKQRKFSSECNKIIKEEVQKLKQDNFIREVYYPNWLANVVVV